MKVKIYVEGGGDGQALRTKCRQGFSKFFESAGLRGRMPSVVACGRRQNAYDSFCTALQTADENCFVILLVDSEEPATLSPWAHLEGRDNWIRPDAASDDSAHLMVQCMEAWFLTDHPTLTAFYGQGFNSSSLPAHANVEQVSKQDIFKSLELATRHSRSKGRYEKSNHSFSILAQLDSAKV